MIIALAQLNYHIGNFERNHAAIAEAIGQAKMRGADLIVFAELAIGGYPAKDLLRSDAFLDRCEQAIENVAALCEGIACIIGAPVRNRSGKGKPLYNAALLLAAGTVQQVVHKGLLPDYDVFDEYRYFQPADSFHCLTYQNQKIALTICEDLWNTSAPQLYPQNPMDALRTENPDVIINVAASPFSYNHLRERMEVLQAHAKETGAPLLYVNQVGAHADLIFDGRSLVLSSTGERIDMLASFDEDLKYYELQEKNLVALQETAAGQPPWTLP